MTDATKFGGHLADAEVALLSVGPRLRGAVNTRGERSGRPRDAL